jgi:signal peptidase I
MLIAAICRGVLALLVSLLLWSVIPAALDWHVTVVMSGSMEPALRPGDVVASRPIPAEQVRPAQVLLVNDPDHAGRLRMHRLVKIRPDGTLILRGDANAAADSTPVRRSAVQGVGSLRVPLIGSPAYWAQTGQRGHLLGGAAALMLVFAGACAWRDDDEDADGDLAQPPSRAAGDAPQLLAVAAGPAAAPPPSSIRRAAFTGRFGRVAIIGLSTAALIGAGVATDAPALAVPFQAATSTPGNTWSAARVFTGCASAALADNPDFDYPLDERSGRTAADASGNDRIGTYSGNGVSHDNPGPCRTTARVTELDGSGVISTSSQISPPGPWTFTEEVWFRSTDYHGGSLLGYASTPTGTPSQYDRQLYLAPSGRVVFGVYTPSSGVQTIATSYGFNDGGWHLATASLSSAGMKLYIDGRLLAVDPSVTRAQNAGGYWRIGMNPFSSDWPSAPTSAGFVGDLSGAAVYSTALSADRVLAHYDAR